jgi:hypothetical protein
MAVGLGLVAKPLSVLADVIPMFGNLVGRLSGLVAILAAIPLSLGTIAVAWIVFRPLLGVGLLALAAGAILLLRKIAKPKPAA